MKKGIYHMYYFLYRIIPNHKLIREFFWGGGQWRQFSIIWVIFEAFPPYLLHFYDFDSFAIKNKFSKVSQIVLKNDSFAKIQRYSQNNRWKWECFPGGFTRQKRWGIDPSLVQMAEAGLFDRACIVSLLCIMWLWFYWRR